MAESAAGSHIAPRIDATAAGKRLSKRLFARKTHFRVGSRGDGTLPFLELVWLPAYLFEYQNDSGASAFCMVEAMSGVPKLTRPDDFSFETKSNTETFVPAIAQPHAQRIARETLLRTALRRRRESKFDLDTPQSVALVHYPYWVYYYRRRNLIDIKILDGVTCEKPGHKVKLGILDAFQRDATSAKGIHGESGD